MKEQSIRNFLFKSDEEIKKKVDALCKKRMGKTAHEYKEYGDIPIGDAAKKHVEKAQTTKPGTPPAIRLMQVVLSAHRKEERVTPFINNVKGECPNLTLSQLYEIVEMNDYVSFAQTGWWHKDQQKFDTLKALIEYFLCLYGKDVLSDDDRFRRWLESCDSIPWEQNPIREIRNVGLATFQHLRLSFGANTVKPDHWVTQVLAKEFGAKLTGLKAIHAVEEIAKITNRDIREIDQIFVKYGSSGHLSNGSRPSASSEELAEQLSREIDYRVLRRLALSNELAPSPVGQLLATGIVVDTETTGLDPNTDKIIEIGIVAFTYDPSSGKPIQVIDTYTAFEDPEHPLSEQTRSITGITDDMVANQRLDDQRVNALAAGADVVIAHNANFDRAFLEKRLPIFAELPWGCSLRDVDWSREKLGSRKLEFIAFKLGFFFDAHRALEDCKALLKILSLQLPISKNTALKQIIDGLSRIDHTVFALNAPFANKEMLKTRQYQWNTERKCWQKTLTGSTALDEEMIWLKDAVYDRRAATISVEHRDARSRYSNRSVPQVSKMLGAAMGV